MTLAYFQLQIGKDIGVKLQTSPSVQMNFKGAEKKLHSEGESGSATDPEERWCEVEKPVRRNKSISRFLATIGEIYVIGEIGSFVNRNVGGQRNVATDNSHKLAIY